MKNRGGILLIIIILSLIVFVAAWYYDPLHPLHPEDMVIVVGSCAGLALAVKALWSRLVKARRKK